MSLFVNGVRFHTPLEATITRLVERRPFVESAQMQRIARIIAARAVALVDQQALGKARTPTNPLGSVWQEAQKQIRENNAIGHRTVGFDLACTWTLYAQGPHTLGLFTSDDAREMQPMFLEPGDEDWSWGHYEPSPSITPQNWAQREEDWTALLGGSAQWVPAYRGVTLSFHTPRTHPNHDLIMANLPTLEDRARALAKDTCAEEAARAAHEKGEDILHAIIRSVDDSKIDALAASMERTLPTITIDLLLGRKAP